MHHAASPRKLEAAPAPIQPLQAVTLACGEKLTSATITAPLLEGGKPVRLELLVSRPSGEDQGHSLLAHPDLWRGPLNVYLAAPA